MTLTERLTKANNVLLSLSKKKSAIKERIKRARDKISELEDKISTTENELENMVEEKVTLDEKAKLWNDILQLKEEKKNAEKALHDYRKQLEHKFKKMKKLSDKLGEM